VLPNDVRMIYRNKKILRKKKQHFPKKMFARVRGMRTPIGIQKTTPIRYIHTSRYLLCKPIQEKIISHSKLTTPKKPQRPLDGKLTFTEIITCSLATTIIICTGLGTIWFGIYSLIILFVEGNPFPFVFTIFGSCVLLGCVGNFFP
jgi:hypothetical protein